MQTQCNVILVDSTCLGLFGALEFATIVAHMLVSSAHCLCQAVIRRGRQLWCLRQHHAAACTRVWRLLGSLRFRHITLYAPNSRKPKSRSSKRFPAPWETLAEIQGKTCHSKAAVKRPLSTNQPGRSRNSESVLFEIRQK